MDKKEIRKALNAIKSTHYKSKSGVLEDLKMVEEHGYSEWFVNYVNNQVLIHKYYDFIGLTEEERKIAWFRAHMERVTISKSYNHMPRAARRDNGDTYNRGSGYGRNSMRVPSKKRSKRVWKKFYKLFPHMDPNNKVNELSV